MTEQSIDVELTDGNVPLPDRISFAKLVIESDSAGPSLQAKAACWLTYRLLEAHQPDGSFCEAALLAIGNEPVEPVRLRWTRSLTMAWCYTKIAQGCDARGYLWKINDWNYLKHEASAAVNMARAMLLFSIYEFAAGGPVVANAMSRLHDICRVSAILFNFADAPEVRGVEYESIGRVVRMATSLRPYLGLDFSGVIVPLEQILAIETDPFFRSALTIALRRAYPANT